MFTTNALFMGKEENHRLTECSVNKVVRLSGAEYDSFTRDFFQYQDFITDNIDSMKYENGVQGCILVVGEGRNDGVLVNSSGYDYARYTAFIPNVESFLTVGRYQALAELNKKLTEVVDYIAKPIGQRYDFDIAKFEEISGINFEFNDTLMNTLLGMLDERPEISGVETENNELIVYYSKSGLEKETEILIDPSVTKTDMYAYGYGWDGMIPLGKERALELFDNGHEVFRLYEDDAEGAASERDDIESYDGIFGIEDPAWVRPEQEPLIQVFILNREKYDKGEVTGEWLTLPVHVSDVCDMFERIGIDRPSEGAFTISAIRVRDDYLRDYISKYDSLDELNMLASYMADMEEYELDKFQAILTSGVADIWSGTASLINILNADNFDAFELIDANDAESLAKYYDHENDEKPDDISFEDYGKKCVKEEGGKFTEWGYIKLKYNDLSPQYTGVVPNEYKITSMALHSLRLSKPEKAADGKASVMEKIKEAQKNPAARRVNKDVPDKNKRKGGQDL